MLAEALASAYHRENPVYRDWELERHFWGFNRKVKESFGS